MEEKREMPAETGAASALWYQNVSLDAAAEAVPGRGQVNRIGIMRKN